MGSYTDMTGVFDLPKVKKLYERFPSDMNDGKTIPTSPYSVEGLVDRLLIAGICPRKMKTCDLGSGHGYFMASFAVNNFPVYGIEEDAELARKCEELFKISLEATPQLIVGDYFSINADARFPDGTRLQDIDMFYCNAYHKEHAKAVLMSLTKFAKLGAFAYMCAGSGFWPDKETSFLKQFGFEPIPTHPYPNHMLLKHQRQ